ncbi:MFS transporter [Sphingomonas sp. LH128]|uniref:MFS transporter n=1 Tax=Sphingomonas sp. LH128 TaxID=473781 RepID=UPI00268309BF
MTEIAALNGTQSVPNRTGRIPIATKVGWAFGSAGSTTVLYVVNVILMYYLVTATGMDPALAGSFMLAGRIYDGIADLLIGQGSDRTRSRWGRRRPWMAAGALLSGLGMAWLFSGSGAGGSQAVMVMGALLLTFTGYSAFAIPSSAMPAEITDSPQERTSLMAWRTFFIQLAALAGGALAPAMIAWGGSSADAFARMGYCMAAFIFVSMAVAVVATGGLREHPVEHERGSALAGFAQLFANRPFIVLLGVKFCGFIASAAVGATGLFFMRDVLARGETGMAQFALASGVVGTMSVPVWRQIARFAPKPVICAAALVLSAAISLSWLAASPAEGDALFLLRGGFAGFATTGTLLMTLSMLPDTIAFGVRRSGLRKEGLYAAFFEFFQKAAFALAPFLVGLFLQASGYRSGTGTALVQSEAAREAVRLSMALIPAVAQVAGIVLLLFYRMPAENLAEPAPAPHEEN